MRRAPNQDDRLAMTTEPQQRTLRVELELAEGHEPIQGQLRDARGTRAPFTGWLELIQIIDQLRTPHSGTGMPGTEP
jgi:hypothetical protein